MPSHQVNEFRRKAMRLLTKNLAKPTDEIYDPNRPIKRVLISRPNQRLGNLLLITPLIAEVQRIFPNCEIDVFVKGGLAPIIFNDYHLHEVLSLPKKPFKDFVNYIKVWKKLKSKQYDLAINVDHNSSSGRIAVDLANARFPFFGEPDVNEDIETSEKHIAKYPVLNLRNYLINKGFPITDASVAKIDIRLSDHEIEMGKQTLDRLVEDPNKKTLSIFTFATGTKCYSKEWWSAFYERLKLEFPEYNILEILPVENVSQIDFHANTFYSKDVREMGAVMRKCAAFIGADSGIMHLASASMAKTIGLFSVTNISKYIPYGNGSVGINTNENDLDAIMQKIRTALLEK